MNMYTIVHVLLELSRISYLTTFSLRIVLEKTIYRQAEGVASFDCRKSWVWRCD